MTRHTFDELGGVGGESLLPEPVVDAYIWDREALETQLGRPLTDDEEKDYWTQWNEQEGKSDAA